MTARIQTLESNVLVLSEALPPGAVVAFTRECSGGWRGYDEAAGKFMLGAGQGKIRYRGPHRPSGPAAEASLTKVDLFDEGGEENHQLTIGEMPSHAHRQNWGQGNGISAGSKTYGNSVFGEYSSTIIDDLYTNPEGKNVPHNNMPPFISLIYCQISFE